MTSHFQLKVLENVISSVGDKGVDVARPLPRRDVPVGCLISGGFAGAALESDGFLLFFLGFFLPPARLSASFYLLLFSFIPQSPLLTRSSIPESPTCF